MPKIAISYRRNDSTVIAGRIADRLAVRYGKESVFIDVDSIPLGTDFRKYIRKTWDDIDVLIVVVGPKWLGGEAGTTTRIHESEDLIRIEVETALKREVPIIPVLVEGAAMPSGDQLPKNLRALADRNAAEVDGGRDFHPHMDRLIQAIDRIVSSDPQRSPAAKDRLSVDDRNSSPLHAAKALRELLPIILDIAVTIFILLASHYLIINVFDLNTLYLRASSFIIPFISGIICFRHSRQGPLAATAIAGVVALMTVAGMSLSTALSSGRPIAPTTPFEWRESIEYCISIAIAFFVGYVLAGSIFVPHEGKD